MFLSLVQLYFKFISPLRLTKNMDSSEIDLINNTSTV